MSVLALVSKHDDAVSVVTWASYFAQARDTHLVVLCWTFSATDQYPLMAGEAENCELNSLVVKTRDVVGRIAARDGEPAGEVRILTAVGKDSVASTLSHVQSEEAELVVAASPDPSGLTGATYQTNELLRQTPCNTIVLFSGSQRSLEAAKVVVGVTQTAHDLTAVALAARLARACGSQVTLMETEEDTDEEAVEVGKREVRVIMREAGIKSDEPFGVQVFIKGQPTEEALRTLAAADLALLGVGHQELAQRVLAAAPRATVAVIKRSPPLSAWGALGRRRAWIPRLNPGDYADLVLSLRRGSRLNADFLIMLGFASAIASFGLMQDSAAVVIGSMLLAPLMTPIVGAGLALVQANPRYLLQCLKTIGVGLFLVLVISCVVGIFRPGGSGLTAQLSMRGAPNTFDLFVAICSAAAAAYALARPSLVGAVAGVAIATALVPPLCTVGISLASGYFDNAIGATVLFFTNVLAIILGAAVTFQFLGVSAAKAAPRHRRGVYPAMVGIAFALVLLAIPLAIYMNSQIERGRAQPAFYPVARDVVYALERRLQQDEGIALMLLGRPSIKYRSDVFVVLVSDRPLPRGFADEIADIVRTAIEDDELVVRVIAVRESWLESD